MEHKCEQLNPNERSQAYTCVVPGGRRDVREGELPVYRPTRKEGRSHVIGGFINWRTTALDIDSHLVHTVIMYISSLLSCAATVMIYTTRHQTLLILQTTLKGSLLIE